MDKIFYDDYEKYINSTKTPSEECLENAVIYNLVTNLGYTYREDIKDFNQLKDNFRLKFEELNNEKIPDRDFENWWISFNSGDIISRFKRLKDDKFKLFDENGNEKKTFKYFDLKNIENNKFEVVNQIWNTNDKNEKRRFDILILINGIPSVHIELKKETKDIDNAARQISNYCEEGALRDFLMFTKIYVISNGLNTRYFVNNRSLSKDILNMPFKWLKEDNSEIDGVHGILDFCDIFLKKEFILDFLENYYVIDDSEKKVLFFRPYQYYASNKIIENIKDPNKSNKQKSGYVWHATGSGKTLTSFKTCEILSQKCEEVDLTIFLIDRNDLNTQTNENFKSYANDKKSIKNATNTENLIELLNDNTINKQIIITTIQKLNNALRDNNINKIEHLKNRKVVFMVDECHRSQIGLMRKNIDNFFENSINIAFTGTPIFTKNSTDGKTTESIFGECIHRYTTRDAIKDKNVLDFVFDFKQLNRVGTSEQEKKFEDDLDDEIDNVNIQFIEDERLECIKDFIFDNFNQCTVNRNFNAILACSSIPEAIRYYKKFIETNKIKPENQKIKCAILFSINKNDNSNNVEISRESTDFMLSRIKEYNSSWDITSFNKYKDHIQEDFKKHRYDLIIVVSMLLTGFDSKITNTLFLDKNLRYQSLIQAISRTNRLNPPGKETGNIICFKTDRKTVDDALELYTNGGISNIRIESDNNIKTYENIKDEFTKKILELKDNFSVDQITKIDHSNYEEAAKFVNLFKNVLQVYNKIRPLYQFNWKDITDITEREFNQYKSICNEIVKKPGNKKILEIYNDYEIIDFDKVKVDIVYLNKLLKKIKKYDANTIPEDINEFKPYQDLVRVLENNNNDDQSIEIIKDFLKNKNIYTCGDYQKIIDIWKDYIKSKIESIKKEAIVEWKTTVNIFDEILEYFSVKEELDEEYIEKKLPEYIDDPLFCDEKIEIIQKKLLKVKKLIEMSPINI